MILELPSLFSKNINYISEFTLEDFRSISFMIENDSDENLYNMLRSKISKNTNSIDSFNLLLNARIKYVSETVTFNNGSGNVNVNLDIWYKEFLKNISNIQTKVSEDNITLTLDYPQDFLFDSDDDILISCIKQIEINDRFINFIDLSKEEKCVVFEKLSVNLIDFIKDFVRVNRKPLILMAEKLDLPEIGLNFFDNSMFSLIKTIYSYYSYEDIIELLFILSRRVNDITFLNSRTPRDLNFLVRLYEEELVNSKHNDK